MNEKIFAENGYSTKLQADAVANAASTTLPGGGRADGLIPLMKKH